MPRQPSRKSYRTSWMTNDEAIRRVHWVLSSRFAGEMFRVEKESPETLVSEMRDSKHLSGRILHAIKLMEELWPELKEQ
jgi:uncharacterized protein YbaR (Trm112 family)